MQSLIGLEAPLFCLLIIHTSETQGAVFIYMSSALIKAICMQIMKNTNIFSPYTTTPLKKTNWSVCELLYYEAEKTTISRTATSNDRKRSMEREKDREGERKREKERKCVSLDQARKKYHKPYAHR